MNKRQIKRAARLFALASIAKMDCAGCDTDEEATVVEVAIQDAVDGLWRAGVDPRQVGTLDDCLAIAKGTRDMTREPRAAAEVGKGMR